MDSSSETRRESAAPARSPRSPDFLIIGAAKSGTSTLFNYMRRHPRIFASPIKEPEFFARKEVFERGFAWYHSLFDGAHDGQLCGEASTGYTRWPQWPDSAARIAAALPNVKIIYLLRHPVDRAYSHYVHRVTKELYPGKPIPWPFEEHILRDPMCLDGSRYMDQIEQYLRYYPRESFLLLLTKDLEKDPAGTLSHIWTFLGIEPVNVTDEKLVSNETRSQRESKIRRHATTPLRKIPGAVWLADRLPRPWKDGFYARIQKSVYGRWVKRRHTPPPMKPETRERLLEEFRAGNEKLAEFMGRDLSEWSK